MDDQPEIKPKCSKSPLTAGVVLLGIGLIFLLSNFDLLPGMSRSWPLILVVIGAALLLGGLRSRD